MDNVRLFLVLTLGFLGLLLWEAWQADYVIPQQRAAANATQPTSSSPNLDTATPDIPLNAGIDQLPAAATTALETIPDGRLIHILTDTLDLQIDTRGGTVVDAKLVQYPVSVDTPDIKFQLLSQRPSDYFIAQSGLLSSDKDRAPTHDALYTSAKSSYVMREDEDQLIVDLVWKSNDGLQVTKRFTFQRGQHAIQLSHRVKNASSQAWKGRDYRQFQRSEPADSGNFFMYTYTGGAAYSLQDKYKKYDFEDLGEGLLNQDVTQGWIAMLQHYFLGAFIPPQDSNQHFYSKKLNNGRAVIGTYSAAQTVTPGTESQFDGILLIGPKLRIELESLAEGLDLTVDYGWLVFIAKPMHWVLEKIHAVVGNWGWTIILFTVLIKLLFFKLSEKSYHSMANMRKLTPRIQALKDRYGDDKQRMQKAMMDMYKKEKINPLGGCLPMLVQMPFFIALYWVLLESVEMRQAPWIFWLEDLSIKDPYFILPILMGASMFFQQKLNPAPTDPMQAKMMQYLPLIFTGMFAFFPSGLVLYWVTNNILSIAQQWVITRRVEQEA
jgi:YidC/Oxa1 family membrane protein insertase